MDEYYQNGPLPTWIGWYVQHLPHWFQAGSAAGTLVLELAIVWMLFLPRRVRILCFFIVTPWEIGVILTANYTFLNYLVLVLGCLLLDDRFLQRVVPARFRSAVAGGVEVSSAKMSLDDEETVDGGTEEANDHSTRGRIPRTLGGHFSAIRLAVAAVMLTWIFYDTTAEMIGIPFRESAAPHHADRNA